MTGWEVLCGMPAADGQDQLLDPAGDRPMSFGRPALLGRNGFGSGVFDDVHFYIPGQNTLRQGDVEVAFPGADDHGGDAVANKVAERPGHADEPVDGQDKDQADGGNGGHGAEGGGEDDDGRSGNAVGALGGDEGDAEDQQQVAERQRGVGSLGDEYGGEGKVDGKRIEVERVAGRHDQTNDGRLDPHPLQLAHDLGQDRVRRGGGEDDGQFLAGGVE